MFFSKTFLTLATIFGSALLTSAFEFKQIPFKTESGYDAQGFHILQNDAIEGYSVRIKKPESCEDGVQVNNSKTMYNSLFYLHT
jgi:cathepsin A (carboxypeptidase C)